VIVIKLFIHDNLTKLVRGESQELYRIFVLWSIGGAGEICTPVQKFSINMPTSLDRFEIFLMT